MDVSVADAACMHLHQHLIGSGLRLRNFFDLPRTAHRGNDCSFHTHPPKAIGCECFVIVALFCMPHTTRLPVSWRNFRQITEVDAFSFMSASSLFSTDPRDSVQRLTAT